MMRRKIVLGMALALAAGTVSASDETTPLRTEARAIVKRFMGALKAELQAGMKAGGPVRAIEACNIKAPAIARHVSQETGWEVGRTSLRLRNPDNAPDPWERRVLERFEQRRAAGEDPKRLEYAEVVTEGGVRYFRYMKAIPTQEVCTRCHGTAIAPEVAAKLDALYPADRARGFRVGDIRGAFTFRKRL